MRSYGGISQELKKGCLQQKVCVAVCCSVLQCVAVCLCLFPYHITPITPIYKMSHDVTHACMSH